MTELSPSDRDKIAVFVQHPEHVIPSANPENKRTFIHDDIVAVRYKYPFLPIVGIWQESVTVAVSNAGVVEIDVPNDAVFCLLMIESNSAVNPLWVGIDSAPQPTNGVVVAGGFGLVNNAKIGPLMCEKWKVLRALGTSATAVRFTALFWSSLA